MKKTLMFVFTAIMTLSFAGAASADVRPVKEHLVKFTLGKAAINAAGIQIVKTLPEQVLKGKKVMVMKSEWKLQRIVDRFADMLKTGEKVNGGRVVGMAYQNHSETWNITVRDGDRISIINISGTKEGSDLQLRSPMNAPIRKK